MTTPGQQYVTPFGEFLALNEKSRGFIQTKAVEVSVREKMSKGEVLIHKYLKSKGNRAFVSVRNIARGLNLPCWKIRLGIKKMLQHAELMHSTAQKLHNYGGCKTIHLYALPDMYAVKEEEKKRATNSNFYETWKRQCRVSASTSIQNSLSNRCSTSLAWSWTKKMLYSSERTNTNFRHASLSFSCSLNGETCEVLGISGGLYSFHVAQFFLQEVEKFLQVCESSIEIALREALAHCHEKIKENDSQWGGKGWDGCSAALVVTYGNKRTVISVGSVSIFNNDECVQPRHLPSVPCLLDRSVPLQFGCSPCWPVLGMKNMIEMTSLDVDFSEIPCHTFPTSQCLRVVLGHGVSEDVFSSCVDFHHSAEDQVKKLVSKLPKPSCIEEMDCVTVLVLQEK